MLKRYTAITAACVIYAVGYACFLSPNHLAPGGVSGLAVILGEFIPVNKGIIILLLNIPLLAVGATVFGRAFFFSTVYASVVSSLFISAAALLPAGFLPVTHDLLTAGLAGGALIAVGMGLIFRQNATTGGTDIVVSLIRRKIPYVRTGVIFLAVDSLVVALSAAVFGDVDLALYAAVSLFVSTKVFDAVLFGTNSARLLLIITRCPEKVIGNAAKTLKIGITAVKAKGGYTLEEKTLLVCAVRKAAFPAVKEWVLSVDPEAFMIVSSADEIYGKGFISHGK